MSPERRWCLVALTVAACTASFLVGGVAAQPQDPQAQPRVLRIMTYNIKHGQTNAVCTQPAATPGQPPSPDCNLDLQATIEVIRRHDPDIVGVQEVDRFWARSAHVDQPSVLSARTSLDHYCYGANLDHAPDSHSDRPHQYGTVMLSRFPILECTNTLLPLTGTSEQRGLTRALIDVQGTRLEFYNTHLHTTAADRVLQTARIAAVVDDAGAGSKVLVGDFNARPPAAEMAPVYERFLDAWQKAGTPAPENPDGHTSPARLTGDPTSRIDYIFVSPDVALRSASVPVDDRTRLASDHYPVVAEMVLPGPTDGIIGREARVEASRKFPQHKSVLAAPRVNTSAAAPGGSGSLADVPLSRRTSRGSANSASHAGRARCVPYQYVPHAVRVAAAMARSS